MSDGDLSRLAAAVSISVDSGAFTDADEALVELAKRYAELMDAAQANADEFGELEFEQVSGNMFKRLERLEARVNVATVAAELGPKLLAALTALGLSPDARNKLAKGGKPDDGGVNPAAAALAALRTESAGLYAVK